MSKKIRILIADDHAIVRKGLSVLFDEEPDLSVVGEAPNGEAVLDILNSTPVDIVIMDLIMPKMDGATTTLKIHENYPSVKVLILTSYGASDDIAHAIEAGAQGAMLKSSENSDIINAIRSIHNGKVVISEELKRIMHSDPPIRPLSPRQQEILASLTRGLTNKEISTQLGISTTSVQTHVLSLYEKIGAANRSEAIAIALRKHLLKI